MPHRLIPHRLNVRWLLVVTLVLLSGFSLSAPIAQAQDAHLFTIVDLVNQARSNIGVGCLSMNSSLVSAASTHNNAMIAANTLSHQLPGEPGLGTRVNNAGYSWSAVGENILFRFDQSATGAFSQWWNSPPHQANMLNGSFTEIGLAFGLESSSGRFYYTMVLARPSGGGGGASCPPPGGAIPGVAGASGSLGGAITDQAVPENLVNAGDRGAPITVNCLDDGGVSIWSVNLQTSEGREVIRASGAQVANALAQAVQSGQNVTIAREGVIGLYALSSNEIQAQGRDLRDPSKYYDVIFSPERCETPTTNTPSNTTTTNTPGTTTTTNVPTGGTTHVVQRGETLFSIGRRYGVSFTVIAAANGITNPTRIFPGQVLTIPGATTTTTTTTTTTSNPPASGTTYTVVAGDNLYRIALRFNVTLDALMTVNNIIDPTRIYVGQVLIIPQ